MKTTRFLRPLVSALAPVMALLAARPALADTPPPACDESTYACYVVPNVVLSKSGNDLPFQNKLNSGWIPSCKGGKPNES